tara:strand:- start:708 stop:926 length:219 start_codon:yes stop_codon:yes gene_type:complete
MSRKKQKYYKENYVRYTLGIKKGNVYKYIQKDVFKWLTDQALESKVDNLGIIISAILTDTYHEHQEEVNREE